MPVQHTAPVMQLRVALTTSGYARLVQFYCAGLGLEPAQVWTNNNNHGLMLEMGKATLEIFDDGYARHVDELEAGMAVSGRIRLALQVPDLHASMERLLANGATLVHAPVETPWGDYNVRLQDPDGLQVTLFQVRDHNRSADPPLHTVANEPSLRHLGP